jgi:ABC-type phosphate transport system substrate-binding protein
MLSLSRARAFGVAGITALGLGAAGSMITASTSLAAAPSGTACSTDGKINARGSTLQTWLQEDLIGKYASDVCGPVGQSTNLQDSTDLYYQGPGIAAPFQAVDPTDPMLTQGGAADAAAIPASSGSTEPYYGGDWMISYNPYAAANFGETGSTYGRIAMSCRTDAFGGTDIPYSVSQYNAINGAPGASANAAGSANGKQCQTTTNASGAIKPPTDPNLLTGAAATGTWSPAFEATPAGGFPQASDPTGTSLASNGTGSMMSFPIGESAVDFPINLQTTASPARYCGTGGTTGLTTKPAVKLSVADILGLMGGIITNWNQLDGASTYTLNGVTYNDTGENPNLSACNLTVQRVVRADDSGTTQAVVNFLNDASGSTGPGTGAPGGSSTVPTCVPSTTAITGTFGDLDSDIVATGVGHNNLWPGEAGSLNAPTQGTPPAGCTEVTPGGFTGAAGNTGVSGGPALLKTLEATSGGIGYADLSDEQNDAGVSILTQPTVETAASPTLSTTLGYVSTMSTASPKGTPNGSNCKGSISLPGTGASDVGLSGDYALDVNQSGTFNPSNSDDISWANEPAGAYPACTLTWDYVWGNDDTASGPEPELNNDQRRTLYSYFTYVFSSAAQSSLAAAGYAPLPASVYDLLRPAFQSNF